jgi:ATP-dependent DNA helicase RecG
MQLNQLKRIGSKTLSYLHKLGIFTLEDVLFHLPYRYQDRTRIVPIGSLRVGDQAVIEGEVVANQVVFRGRRQLQIIIKDASGAITLRFFYFNSAQQKNLLIGTRLRCFGEVRQTKRELNMIHPEYRRLDNEQVVAVDEVLTPIYPTTDGLSQHTWQSLSKQALVYLKQHHDAFEILPLEIQQKLALPSLVEALQFIHRPPPDAPIEILQAGTHRFQQRLAFEELLTQQISLRQLRLQLHTQNSYKIEIDNAAQQTFLKQLKFPLTNAQQKVVAEIQQDLQQAHPMLRLVQGDVGSGKTAVAGLAAMQAISNGYQMAIMAPTELLAEQHFQTFTEWFKPLGINVVWLVSKLKVGEKRTALAAIADGSAQIIIGTHALFQKGVEFAKLALVIIDEQHRFGVAQRLALQQKGVSPHPNPPPCSSTREGTGFSNPPSLAGEGRVGVLKDLYPHQLVLTATPIPRTLAMTFYADLDVSVIDELPPGRTPINTIVIGSKRRDEIIERVENICISGGQCYWVCPLIEKSEVLECEAAEITAENLQKLLPQLKIGLVHGRLKSAEKESIMHAFKKGGIDVLVATTVIEVGINVPNASLMIIENPERMGLAQLHQLRGRVGRGSAHSHCVLLYQTPLSELARKRLTVMRESTDGFYIAQQDLELRGAGELLGTQQTGVQQLRIADLFRDKKLLPKVQAAANTILNDHPDVVEKLIQRWIGHRNEYGRV